MKNRKFVTVSLAAALAIGTITANGVLVSADAEKEPSKSQHPQHHMQRSLKKQNQSSKKKAGIWKLPYLMTIYSQTS